MDFGQCTNQLFIEKLDNKNNIIVACICVIYDRILLIWLDITQKHSHNPSTYMYRCSILLLDTVQRQGTLQKLSFAWAEFSSDQSANRNLMQNQQVPTQLRKLLETVPTHRNVKQKNLVYQARVSLL